MQSTSLTTNREHLLTFLFCHRPVSLLATRREEQQRLPNELLLLIIEYFAKDLKQLHSFLFINRVFFRAAVKLIYADPVDLLDPEHSISRGNFEESRYNQRRNLSGLLLGSFLQHANEDPRTALEAQGLELVLPITDPFLKACFREDHNHRLDVDAPENSDYEANSKVSPLPPKKVSPLPPKTTINYSKHLMWPRHSELLVDWSSFLRLKEIPSRAQMIPYMIHGLLKDEIHSLFLRYNATYIHRLTLRMDEVPALVKLGLHLEMSSLKVVTIIHSYMRPAQDHRFVGDLRLFIQGNQSAFPTKGPLDVYLEGMNDTSADTYSEAIPSEASALQEWALQGRLGVYAAVGSPLRMKDYATPWFYERLAISSIDIRRLQAFSDNIDRSRRLEGHDMSRGCNEAVATKIREFLRQCQQLQELSLFVSHIDLFKFDEEPYVLFQGEEGPLVRPGVPPTNIPLRDLVLRTTRDSKVLVGALNDAIPIFSGSLKTVYAYVEGITIRDDQPHHHTEASDFLPSNVRLSRRCSTFGYWNAPFLRTLTIFLRDSPFMDVGAFEMCPQLEELYLGTRSSPIREEDIGPSSESDLQLLLNHSELPPWLDPFKLFPKWTLPKLRSLKLEGSAVLQFNYESFEGGMPNLMTIEFDATRGTSILEGFEDRIPRLSRHLNLATNSYPTEPQQDSWPGDGLPMTEVSPSEDEGMWTKKWHLPKLRRLSLLGPCACVFNWDRLLDHPLLRTLTINYSHLPAQCASRGEARVSDGCIVNNNERGHLNATICDQVGSLFQQRRPLFESRLMSVYIQGKVAMTEDNMVKLLLFYAPNLRDVSISGSEETPYLLSPTQFLNALTRASRVTESKEYNEYLMSVISSRAALLSHELEVDEQWLNHLRLAPEEEDTDEMENDCGETERPRWCLHRASFRSPRPFVEDDVNLLARFKEARLGRNHPSGTVVYINGSCFVRE